MTRLKCLDCARYTMCDIHVEFQREANNFLNNDDSMPAYIEAQKKVRSCEGFKPLERV